MRKRQRHHVALAWLVLLEDGPGYADADGFSNMPSYIDALTVCQWLDLVAYLNQFAPGREMGQDIARRGSSDSFAEPG